MTMKNLSALFLLLAYLLLIGSCNSESSEGPTRGKLHVVLEESVAPPLIRVIGQFNALYYPNAVVSYSVLPFSMVGSAADMARMIFSSEWLKPGESLLKGATPINLIVAYDAVVAIVGEENGAQGISTEQLQNLVAGKKHSWKDVDAKTSNRMQVTLTLSERAIPLPFIARRFSATSYPQADTQTSSEVVSRVEGSASALGLVGIGWVDSLRAAVKILSVARSNSDTDTIFAPPKEALGKPFSPHPANLYLNYYPLKRAVWMFGATTGKDLAAGFSAFVASPEGQKILLQHQWLPATQKIRLKGKFPYEYE